MIWLLTRVMISSTVCPAVGPVVGAAAGAAVGAGTAAAAGGAAACPRAKAGRHTRAIRTRDSLFIGCIGPPRFLGLRAKGGLRARGYFTDRKSTRLNSSHLVISYA